MDRKIRYFVNGWSFRLSFATRPGYDGDHEDISDGDSYELGEYENSEEALAAAEAFISTHGNEVNDEEDGIGSVIYWTVEVERRVEYKENEWLPCDESGRIDDGYGNEPNASAINGIYPEDVADLPTIETAIPRLREIFAGADEVIGYNVGFDLGFLSAVGVRPREDARITDTMKEFTWFMGRRYKLVDAADHIGYEWTGRAHGSLADALATLAVQRWLEQWLVAE